MIMDIQKFQQYNDNDSPEEKLTNIESSKSESLISSKPAKRCFDVAFLMLPDDKTKEKQRYVSKQMFSDCNWKDSRQTDNRSNAQFEKSEEKYSSEPVYLQDANIDVGIDEYPTKVSYYSDSDTSERSRSRPASNESATRSAKYLPEVPNRNKVFDDPTLIMQTRRFEPSGRSFMEKIPADYQRSAFTKVSQYLPNTSPNPSVSPENLIYQNSLSPPLTPSTPPSSVYKMSHFNSLLASNNLINGSPFLRHQQMSNYQHEKRAEDYCKTQLKDNISESSKINPLNVSKLNGMISFRPEFPAYLQSGSPYSFPLSNIQGTFQTPARESLNPLIANPAAALLSTLLPPTLAAFSLPAQNMCAKCNISFRMTSDLVYHMRTHHKSDTTQDLHKRRREDKLKCPVCSESFRERHHLTRHMTAHQDKESDVEDASNTLPHHFYSKGKSKQSGISMSSTIQKRI